MAFITKAKAKEFGFMTKAKANTKTFMLSLKHITAQAKVRLMTNILADIEVQPRILSVN